MFQTISTGRLAAALNEPSVAILDVRPIAAFNGWRLQGEERGGHIEGAAACPLPWAKVITDGDLKTVLADKGVTPEKGVVVYGYGREDAERAAGKLADLGYEEVMVYEAGFPEWAADAQRPVARLARYEKLVYPAWIRQLLNGERPDNYANDDFLLFHVNFGVPEEYESGHLPGAIYLDTNALESERDWNRRSPAELEEALLAHGIRRDKTVILYGRDSTPDMSQAQPGRKAGQIAATRAAAILMYAGVEDVRLLDGGLDAWIAAGYGLETVPYEPEPVASFGGPIPGGPDFFVDLDGAHDLLADPEGVLVSIRSWREYVGETSGYHYIKPAGRIAGAVWGNCGSDAYHMQHYRNVDNTMRAFPEIEAHWRGGGITPEKRIAFYCGTGWRASETFFYAHVMGWEQVAVYDGGWLEWSQDPDNPIETGVPAGASEGEIAAYA